ncbi:unnamed protein product [Cladocopium goreaui]|uniref:3-dehydrosphinganine reductase n=1 Tax=Cladocopium goreaui TaxID=2562237 RepID=A0A9P1FIA7_9DINO|nr:unnamed protein product [Cladocopium goreaui]
MLLAVLGIGGGACALHFLIQWLVCKRMLSLAKLCYTKGAKVTIVARTKKKLEQACEEVRKIQSETPGAKIQNISMDVSSMRSAHFAELMTEAAQAEGFGRVDVVVCNAGTGVAKLLVGTPLEQIDELMDAQISTNLLGSLRCASAAAQVMASDGLGGRVCIVSSAAGLISLPGYAVYSATKFGHRGFLAGAYHELQQHGVDLSVYYPGSIETPGFEHEKQLMPTVTSRIESSCSDVSKADDAAAVLLAGIEKGTKEITNELLPSLVVDHPTGFAPLDALVAAVTQCIRAGWSTYLRVMARQYISPVSRSA